MKLYLWHRWVLLHSMCCCPGRFFEDFQPVCMAYSTDTAVQLTHHLDHTPGNGLHVLALVGCHNSFQVLTRQKIHSLFLKNMKMHVHEREIKKDPFHNKKVFCLYSSEIKRWIDINQYTIIHYTCQIYIRWRLMCHVIRQKFTGICRLWFVI